MLDPDSDSDVDRVDEASEPRESEKPTARDVVVSRPSVARDYIRDMEEITGRKIHKSQLPKLKEALQEREFEKLSTDAAEDHRKLFENQKFKADLRAEWERQTGQEWPKYEWQDPKTGELEPRHYDIHHIIQNNHGGPHKWWNIHPALPKEHSTIHRAGGIARGIFNPKR